MDCVVCIYVRPTVPSSAITMLHGHAACATHVSLVSKFKGDLDKILAKAIELEEGKRR